MQKVKSYDKKKKGVYMGKLGIKEEDEGGSFPGQRTHCDPLYFPT